MTTATLCEVTTGSIQEAKEYNNPNPSDGYALTTSAIIYSLPHGHNKVSNPTGETSDTVSDTQPITSEEQNPDVNPESTANKKLKLNNIQPFNRHTPTTAGTANSTETTNEQHSEANKVAGKQRYIITPEVPLYEVVNAQQEQALWEIALDMMNGQITMDSVDEKLLGNPEFWEILRNVLGKALENAFNVPSYSH
jgi:hypothetical protein